MKKILFFSAVIINISIVASQLPPKKPIAYVKVMNGVMQPNTMFVTSTNIDRTHRLEQESNLYRFSNTYYELKPIAPKKKTILIVNKIEKLPAKIGKMLNDALEKAKGEAQNYPKATTLWHYYEDKSITLISEKKSETATSKNTQKSIVSNSYEDDDGEDIDSSRYYNELD